MKRAMAQRTIDPASAADPSRDLEKEFETWDWVRAAGVSADDLRKAMRDTANDAEDA